MNNLPCRQCRCFIGNRCSVYQIPSRYKKWMEIQNTGYCETYWPIGKDHPKEIICDSCVYARPGECGYFQSPCDRKEFRIFAAKKGSCDYYKPLPPRCERFIGTSIPRETFVSCAQLVESTLELSFHLPANLDAVIAVARSGLLPGTVLATQLHIPLYSVSPITQRITFCGNGFRLGQQPPLPQGNVLIIDDTASYGGTMARIMEILSRQMDVRRAYTAAVYATEEAASKFDFVCHTYPQPHFLEWCFTNTFWAEHLAYDFDGILCEEPHCYDTEPGYRDFIVHALPLYRPKKWPATVISARCESEREASMLWLERHGIQVKELVLWPFEPEDRWRQRGTIAHWKAGEIMLRPEIYIYAESDPWQAQVISQVSKIPVICPEEKVVYGVQYWKE